MKITTTLIIFTILFMICSRIKAQPVLKQHPNAIYLAMQPVDFGLGIRYDYHISDLGLYSSVSYGDWGLYRIYNVRHHVKLSTGILMPLEDYNGAHFDVTAAINYHYVQSVMLDDLLVNPKIFNPWSFELGLSVKLHNFAIAVRTDILRWEPCVDVGIPLKYRNRR